MDITMKDKLEKDKLNKTDDAACKTEDTETIDEANTENEALDLKDDTPLTKEERSSIAKKIIELEKALDEEKDKYLRVIAEYDNFRKRSLNDRINAAADASAKTIIEILSVIDNFERALAAECTDANYKKGVEMIFNQYLEVLTKLDVKEIEALNKPFDPNFHNAINQIEDENFGENTVCQVFQKGYMLGDRVIRCSMVVVANP